MKTILVVEDDKHINEIVTEYLKADGYKVISASCGRQAEDLLKSGVPADLFILDIMLPHVTGLALLKKLRSDSRHNQTPAIMLTAVSDEYTELLSFEELADDYVTKPFSPKLLVKRVQALLRRVNQSPVAKKSGIYIDEDSYRAFEDEEPVKLTLREYELLKLFLQNPGRVLNRQQLLDAVWGYDYYGDERVVDVHIKNLRKKLVRQIIVTVKGVGYRYDACENKGASL